MANYKQVTLKDSKTGDYLIPRVYGTLGYQVVDGEITPPFDPQLDAYTLQGHEANYFATAAELDEVKTSVSEGKALVAAAVTGKGVSTAADATFQQMATNIGKIKTGYSNFYPYFCALGTQVGTSTPTSEAEATWFSNSITVNMSADDANSKQCSINGSWPLIKDWLMIYSYELTGEGSSSPGTTTEGNIFAFALCRTNGGPSAQLKYQYVKNSQTNIVKGNSNNARFRNITVSNSAGNAPVISYEYKAWGTTSVGYQRAYLPMMFMFMF